LTFISPEKKVIYTIYNDSMGPLRVDSKDVQPSVLSSVPETARAPAINSITRLILLLELIVRLVQKIIGFYSLPIDTTDISRLLFSLESSVSTSQNTYDETDDHTSTPYLETLLDRSNTPLPTSNVVYNTAFPTYTFVYNGLLFLSTLRKSPLWQMSRHSLPFFFSPLPFKSQN
jgi:hypothetical protein